MFSCSADQLSVRFSWFETFFSLRRLCLRYIFSLFTRFPFFSRTKRYYALILCANKQKAAEKRAEIEKKLYFFFISNIEKTTQQIESRQRSILFSLKNSMVNVIVAFHLLAFHIFLKLV